MIRRFKAWKQRRRAARQERKLADPNCYPADLSRDSVETMATVRQFTMTSTERLNGLCEAVRYINETDIEGDIVECGVWRGGSMMAIAEMLKRSGDTSRNLHLFDTFEGMSEPTEADVSVDGATAVEQLASEDKNDGKSVWCVASLQDVQSHMVQTQYPDDRIHYHVGKVEDTIPEAAPNKIALLRLDTDWYESTAHEMEHLFSRLSDGGVLIIDDYGHWQGARRAVDEYFAKHNIGMMLHRLDYTGRIGIHHARITRDAPGRQASGTNQSASPEAGESREAA
ncbi:TylF/MycF/NovP-related O-methyltransferase [Planctomycetes bacterium K23_9]|uniref:Demethyldecarbamoylnovobiocin O-methyltransferase n=1 Tax=Stieleria marina TaxID=1930275 RepID=A0A517NMP7_9BACT|nr:Demethyldecarbamoylnovobiocin O-methyltransferase [Planctomycetes bacterium K23_9]